MQQTDNQEPPKDSDALEGEYFEDEVKKRSEHRRNYILHILCPHYCTADRVGKHDRARILSALLLVGSLFDRYKKNHATIEA